ncbi:TFIIB-type zinc ribbon-containing protein [uncultured Methanobrevibacter sp.]|uniref:transcription initiation factor IIB n=1 Tax=uncultured Methanobrevibacter sp. TaxID=253161 RepID=UPI0026308720
MKRTLKSTKNTVSSRRTSLNLKNQNIMTEKINYLKSQEREEISECPQCGSSDFFTDDAKHEIICSHCGLVVEENIIDFTPSGTAINNDGKGLTQHSMADNGRADGGLGSSLRLNDVNHDQRRMWNRLRRMNNQSKIKNNKDRNLLRATPTLLMLISRLSLPKSIKERTIYIYKEALDKELVRGRTIDGIMAVSLFVACREQNVPRSLKEIEEASGISKRTLHHNLNLIKRELKIKVPPARAMDYVPRFTSNLGLSNAIESKAIEILEVAQQEKILGGKDPKSFAAAAIYSSTILLDERVTQGEIAEATKVTAVTIRNRCKDMDVIIKNI